jgi:hypothetical protein
MNLTGVARRATGGKFSAQYILHGETESSLMRPAGRPAGLHRGCYLQECGGRSVLLDYL